MSLIFFLILISAGSTIRTNNDCFTSSPDDFICSDDGFFPISPTICCYDYFNCVGGKAYLEVSEF